MSEGRVQYGVDEYFQLDETLRPHELVWGYVREVPSPGPPHQDAVFLFTVAWQDHVADHGLGRVSISPMDCVLDRERALVVQPDASFVSTGRAHVITDRVWVRPIWSSRSCRRSRGSARSTSGWNGSRQTACANAGSTTSPLDSSMCSGL